MTTAQVAAELGMQPQSVQKLARKRGLGTRIGQPPTSPLVFTPAEVEALRDRRVGYPAGRPNTPEHRAAIAEARKRPWSQARREAFNRRREAQEESNHDG
jgi:hypothetical protein